MFEILRASLALARAVPSEDIITEESIPTIATTTSNSTKVKPRSSIFGVFFYLV